MIKSINSISFKAIYQNPYVSFSKDQKKIVDDIVSNIKTPDKKGITLEKYFENKQLDFYIDAEKNNTVSLSLLSGVNKDQAMISNQAAFAKKLHIGTYDKSHRFNKKDIGKQYTGTSLDNVMFWGFGLLLLGILSFGCLKSCSKTNAKNLIENVSKPSLDVISNTNKQVAPFKALI